jgi:hypothetical protein
VTTVFLRVAEAHFKSTLARQNQPHTITLHLDFLRRTQAGPALFTVEDKKLGRQASVIHVTLSQDSREEVVGYITNSNMHTEEGVSFPTEYTLHPSPPPVNLALLAQDRDAEWVAAGSMPFAGFRKATQKTQFYFPRRGQRHPRVSDEWIRLRNGERWTNATLGYVADMWLMPIESFITKESADGAGVSEGGGAANKRTAKFWYPTVLLNLDIKKALPEDGVEWLFSRVETKQIKNGRMDLEVVIFDAAGDIVALSHHVALAVSSQRNLAERKTGAKI